MSVLPHTRQLVYHPVQLSPLGVLHRLVLVIKHGDGKRLSLVQDEAEKVADVFVGGHELELGGGEILHVEPKTQRNYCVNCGEIRGSN